VPDLQEVGCGENEGMTKGQWYADWLDGRSTPVDGESLDGFNARLMRGVTQALTKQGPILIVSHGQVFRNMTGIIGAEPDCPIANGRPMFLEPIDRGDGGWSIQVIG